MGQIGRALCLALTIWGVFQMLFEIGSMDEDWEIELTRGGQRKVFAFCAAQGAYFAWRWKGTPTAVQSLFCVLAGCLLAACVMDLQAHIVYRFVWWIGGSASVVLLLIRVVCESREKGACPEFAGGLCLYVLIQQVLFGRLYGRADCHAFCVCAAAQTALGGGFREYAVHIAMAYLGLALTQAIRKNIAFDGNLKTPVPFLPYITGAFLLWVDFMAGKWYI